MGPGAIGSTIAALLYAAGHEVLLCGRTPREAIEVRVDGRAPIVVPGPVHTDPDTVAGPVDVVLLDGNTLLMASSAPRTIELFKDKGYDVVDVDISEYEKLEGCVTCLSVRLRGLPS